ncbi:MAG: hypothetical protein ACERLB_16185 [Gammaproteobacteria bacterium]
MHNRARDESQFIEIEFGTTERPDCEIVKFTSRGMTHDSLSEMFNDEIDAWARRALAANGFGDY